MNELNIFFNYYKVFSNHYCKNDDLFAFLRCDNLCKKDENREEQKIQEGETNIGSSGANNIFGPSGFLRLFII